MNDQRLAAGRTPMARASPMRIGFLSQPFDIVEPPVDGRHSIPMLTHGFAVRLAAQGHNVTIYARGECDRVPPGPKQPRLVHFGPNSWLTRVALGTLRRLWPIRRTEQPFLFTRWFEPVYALRSALDARSRRLQIIHVQNFLQYAVVFKHLCPRIKVVVHMHCEWLNQIECATVREYLKHVDLVVCCSEHIRERAIRVLPELRARSCVVYNGVDTGRFTAAAAPTDGQVYFIGRVSPEKGVHVLIEAFDRVVGVRPSARLGIIGGTDLLPKDLLEAYRDPVLEAGAGRFYTGDDAADAERWREALTWPERPHVAFLGALTHTAIIERLRSAALVVQPSLVEEAFGLPVAEAMAMGLPVVVTRGGGLSELVEDGVTGRVVSRGSSAELAAAIIDLLEDPARRRGLGAAGRQRAVERFAFDPLAIRLEEQYARLLGRPARTPPITDDPLPEPVAPSASAFVAPNQAATRR